VRKSRECRAQANSYRRDMCEVVCYMSTWFCSSVLRNVAKEHVMFLSLLSFVSTPKSYFISHLSICSIACNQILMATDLTNLEKGKQLSHQN
jgi:hypothetical protein